MRIINGHDYYDSALVYGHDPKVVFVRDEDKFVPEKTFNRPHADVYFVPPDKVKKEYHWRYKSETLKDRIGQWDFYIVRVIFCGVLYTGIRGVYRTNWMSDSKDDVYFWDRDEFQKWVDQFEQVAIFKGRWLNENENVCCTPVRLTGDEYNYLVKNRISIAIYRGLEKGWELNCSGLRDRQFYKVFDAVNTFQELDMWMSGALGMPGNPIVEVSDDIRMQKHGMDNWSFRKKVR